MRYYDTRGMDPPQDQDQLFRGLGQRMPPQGYAPPQMMPPQPVMMMQPPEMAAPPQGGFPQLQPWEQTKKNWGIGQQVAATPNTWAAEGDAGAGAPGSLAAKAGGIKGLLGA